MLSKFTPRLAGSLFLLLFFALSASAQRVRGELRLEVHDAQGAILTPSGELTSDANQFRHTFTVAQDGQYLARDLPFGVYRLTLHAEGFAPWSNTVEIRSELPVHLTVTMGLAPVNTQVQVNDSATLVDTYGTGTIYTVGRQTISEEANAQSGRDLLDLVADQPGWLEEANGVLHPRGSEYAVQYVVDGLPMTQNRSPAFAPSFDTDEVESLRVITANYPAEYGRKLGGVVELTTQKDVPVGFHGQLDAGGGSFSSEDGSAGFSLVRGNSRFSASADGFHTDRYLDPPVLQNFTNRGNASGFMGSYERDFSGGNRLRITLTHNSVRFLVPNELVQQNAGQRQDIADTETSGQVYFQHPISQSLFLTLSGSARDASASLRSNPASTPIVVSQDRGYREGYLRADLAGHRGHHDWKAGVDSLFTPVHEALHYDITDPTQFDPGTQLHFPFSDHHWDVEPSAYVQDQWHRKNWNIGAGLRFDLYRFVTHDSDWSPRVGVSRFIPALNLLLHASYDRVFQTPAMENLVLASSPQLNAISSSVLRLPVRPSHANYYEGGFTKAILGNLRLDANVFRRDFHDYADDDVLLDTGISFPISFARARIFGEEMRLAVPHWKRFSGYLSYANQSGIGQGPITGGLFLGSEAANQLTNTSKFAVTQDQRNTLRARVRFQAPARVWLALSTQYGSGLPADLGSNPDTNLLLSQYGPAIFSQVDLARGRVRPNFSVDVAGGAELYRKEQRSAVFQIQVSNLADRVNVINFASLFSGTAVAPPRSVSSRLRLTF